MGTFKPETTINELLDSGSISVHLYNCLKTAGFENFDEIFKQRLKYGLMSFMHIKNFGRKALSELEDLLSECYAAVRTEPLPSDELVEVVTPHYDKHVGDIKTFKTIYPTAADFCNAVNKTAEMPRFKGRNLSLSEITDLWLVIAKILTEVLESGSIDKFPDSQRRHFLSIMRMYTLQYDRNRFQLIYEDKKGNPLIKRLMETHYVRLREGVSVRTRNILQSQLPEYTDAIEQYFVGGLATRLMPYCGKKSISEINTLLRQLFDYAYDLMQKDIIEIEHSLISNSYPFLLEEEIKFVQDFRSQHGHLPMFFILYRHFVTSDSKYEKFFCEYNGIECGKKTIAEISHDSGLSFERVRQILSSGSVRPSMAECPEWHHYDDLLTAGYFDKDTAGFEMVRKEERLDAIPFDTFGIICGAIGNFTILRFNNSSVFIDTEMAYSTKIKQALKRLQTAARRRATKTIKQPSASFFDQRLASLDKKTQNKAINAFTHAAAFLFGIGSDRSGNLIFRQNTIDVEQELHAIIQRKGKPMHIADIFAAFKKKYPKHRYSDPQQIRPYLLSSGRITPIGKSSIFALSDWDDVYTGTISQLIFDIVDNSETPVEVKKIFEAVKLKFPNTNYNSVTSMTFYDKRYRRYGRQLVGIAGRTYGNDFTQPAKSRWRNITLDERFKRLGNYLTEHRHLPPLSGNADNAALTRWFNSLASGRIRLSPEESVIFHDFEERYANLIQTKTELAFREKCDSLKRFVEQNGRLPRSKDNVTLYALIAELKRRPKLTARKSAFFASLQQFLQEHGLDRI